MNGPGRHTLLLGKRSRGMVAYSLLKRGFEEDWGLKYLGLQLGECISPSSEAHRLILDSHALFIGAEWPPNPGFSEAYVSNGILRPCCATMAATRARSTYTVQYSQRIRIRPITLSLEGRRCQVLRCSVGILSHVSRHVPAYSICHAA